ncbi:MAG: tRNA (guanosine(37)-N1)-methyltransferase TrmD [Candidatus Omnitrophota bacterium]|nr:tRNA (guanosine(37)-N1)-methyltransferase TrmD [Candidatus Omnitrophota bacterium]
MLIDIITIFPEVCKPYLDSSILGIAQEKGKLEIRLHNLRDYTLDKHRKVDDRPFGGGPGMILTAEPVFRAVEAIKRTADSGQRTTKVILLTPQGKTLNQKLAEKLSKRKHLILICGRYEGVDERVRESLVDEEISIGDYILSGGELAALVLTDSLARLLPGVLGHKDSNVRESFSNNLLEYPQYTRPADFRGLGVPQVLLSGDHKKIEEWRKHQAVKITKKKRPDLLRGP